MRGAALSWIALRELWISYRALALLALGLAGGLLAALAPPPDGGSPELLAWGIAAAGLVVAAMAGATLAAERRRGRVAWLAVRSVSRSAILLAWFGSMALPVLVGLAASALLLSLSTTGPAAALLDPAAIGALVAAAATVVLQGIAAALVAGSLLAPGPAAVVGVLSSGILCASGLMAGGEPAALPNAGIGLLANALSLNRPLGSGLQGMGLGLAATGVLLGLAAAAISRVDL
jgi:hypothetical protein